MTKTELVIDRILLTLAYGSLLAVIMLPVVIMAIM
jgi:hypothetical protein